MKKRLCEIPFMKQLDEVETKGKVVSVLPAIEESMFQTVLLDDGIDQVYTHIPVELIDADKLIASLNQDIALSGFVFFLQDQQKPEAQLYAYQMNDAACETY